MATQLSQATINKALTEKPWVNKVSEFVYRVVPRTLKDARREHGKYEVTFVWDADGLPEIESCVDVRTGESCPGFHFNGSCYHGAALSIRVLRPRLREAA
jgi:hypothetical protein